mmetsp:Transcript_31969/g.56475  ORF Transcript_31969/g.56475 Transcript_31969/m.56475 type:complete len:496 (+) Transcript_31969:40-1527(+)
MCQQKQCAAADAEVAAGPAPTPVAHRSHSARTARPRWPGSSSRSKSSRCWFGQRGPASLASAVVHRALSQLDDAVDSSPEMRPSSQMEDALEDHSAVSKAHEYEYEYLRGDPFEGCKDLATEDLAEWLLDFMVLQGKEKTPHIRRMIATLMLEGNEESLSEQRTPREGHSPANQHSPCSSQVLETLLKQCSERGSMDPRDSQSTSCSLECSSLRSLTQADSNRGSMETISGQPAVTDTASSADWSRQTSDDWELEFVIRAELENERAKHVSQLRRANWMHSVLKQDRRKTEQELCGSTTGTGNVPGVRLPMSADAVIFSPRRSVGRSGSKGLAGTAPSSFCIPSSGSSSFSIGSSSTRTGGTCDASSSPSTPGQQGSRCAVDTEGRAPSSGASIGIASSPSGNEFPDVHTPGSSFGFQSQGKPQQPLSAASTRTLWASSGSLDGRVAHCRELLVQCNNRAREISDQGPRLECAKGSILNDLESMSPRSKKAFFNV